MAGQGTPREGGKPPNLIRARQLSDRIPAPSRSPGEGFADRRAFGRPVRFWPRAGAVLLASTVVLAVLASGGCGGAHAPCPTPTAELDSLRTVAEGLERDVDRETAESRAMEARRDQAARRVEAAQAALDSLEGAK